MSENGRYVILILGGGATGEYSNRPRAAFGTGQAHDEQPRADGRRAGPMQRILDAEGSDATVFLVRAGLERLRPLRRDR